MTLRLAALLALLPLAAAAQDTTQDTTPPRPTPDVMARGARADEVARFEDSAADLVAALAPAAGGRPLRMTLTARPGIATMTHYDPLAEAVSHRLRVDAGRSRDLPVPFLAGSAELTPAARVVLDTLGEALADPALSGARFLIAGHTDADGLADVNAWLSEARAAAAVDHLVRDHGIARSRLVAAGLGEAEPVPGLPADSPRHRRLTATAILADDGTEPLVAAAPPGRRPDPQLRSETAWPDGPGRDAARPGDPRAPYGAGSDAAVPSDAGRDIRRSLAERRRARDAFLADRYGAGYGTDGGGEVPEAIVDAFGRIVGARPVRGGRAERRIVACDPADPFSPACEVVVVHPD